LLHKEDECTRDVEEGLEVITKNWRDIRRRLKPPLDIDALIDYLNSDGVYSDIKMPQMFLKKVMVVHTLKQFERLLEVKIREGSPPDIKLIL